MALGGTAPPRGSAAAAASMRRRRTTSGAASGGAAGTMLQFYTDDAPGLKISPNVVLFMSIGFIAFVAILHVACKALKLRQRSSALTFHPQYETFLRECGLYSVVSLLGQTPCKELVTALLERWRPETNTLHLLQGEATITLEDVEVLTGLPTRGRPVSVGYDDRAADVICQELLGATPPPTRFHGHQVKISWVKEQFDHLPAGAHADVITCYA
ncbi:Protein transport protein Sec61 subunit beta [Linum perenne]